MHRLAPLAALLLLVAAAADAAPTSWPGSYRFFGRWDLRAAGRAVTVNSGSYVRTRFSGAGLSASFDISLNQPAYNATGKPPLGKGSLPTIAWRIDDGAWREAEVAATVRLAEALPPGKHTVLLMVRGLDEHQSRWKAPLTASVTFTGFVTDRGGKLEKPLSAWVKPALTLEFLGDSITEGVIVDEGRAGVVDGIPFTWPWLSDALRSYAAQTALALGAEWRQVGFGATGLAHGGSGGAPGALESFDLFYDGCPRDRWQPDIVVVNQGTNDGGMPGDAYQALYAKYLAKIRSAYPKAWIVALRPFVGAQAASIKAAVDAAGDARIRYVDTTGWYDGPIHPNIDGSAAIAKRLTAALKEITDAR